MIFLWVRNMDTIVLKNLLREARWDMVREDILRNCQSDVSLAWRKVFIDNDHRSIQSLMDFLKPTIQKKIKTLYEDAYHG